MSLDKRDYSRMFRCSKLNMSILNKPITEEYCNAAIAQVIEYDSKFDHRAFVKAIREHPEWLISWGMDESFSDYARRVEADEFD